MRYITEEILEAIRLYMDSNSLNLSLLSQKIGLSIPATGDLVKGKVKKMNNKVEVVLMPELQKYLSINKSKDITNQLTEIASLYEKGLLTDDEFQKAKGKILE